MFFSLSLSLSKSIWRASYITQYINALNNVVIFFSRFCRAVHNFDVQSHKMVKSFQPKKDNKKDKLITTKEKGSS